MAAALVSVALVLLGCSSEPPEIAAPATQTAFAHVHAIADAHAIADRNIQADGDAQGIPGSDRGALVAFYRATGGSTWKDNTNWLSEAPIGQWCGVRTDDDGKVVELRRRRSALKIAPSVATTGRQHPPGVGLPADYTDRGHGFRNMMSYAQRIGGRLEAGPSESGRGTNVTCVIPLDTRRGAP